jgi:phenol 2-monooxygenase
MNVSFQDTYNLTWKICSVIKGLAKPEILQTYELERRTVALDLIRIDKETSAYYAGESTRLPREDLQTFRERVYSFLSGVAVEYGPSVLTASTASYDTCRNDVLCDQSLAAGIVLGRRIPSATIVNHASARPVELASLLPSTGAWRILVFPGDLTEPSQMERISKLGGALSSAQSCLNIFKDRTRTPVSPMIELFAILAGGRKVRDNVPLLSLPDVFHPFDEELGWDYDKVFVDEKSALKDGETISVYERYGIDLLSGCIVACRPDQHVGFIGKLEDSVSLERYFSDILVETRGEKKI